jgi:hypothetical protein
LFIHSRREIMGSKVADTPAEVTAEGGDVRVVGPDGIRYSFSPDAAVETSDRLLRGGVQAQGQRMQEEVRRRKPAP